MSKSSSLKKKGGNTITKKMIAKRMEDVAQLTVAMEAVMMEWEIWYRLIKMQKLSLDRGEITQKDYDFFIQDGPPFTDMSARIMESVRQNIPDFKKEKEEADLQEKKPAILGADGFATTPSDSQQKPTILGSNGLPSK